MWLIFIILLKGIACFQKFEEEPSDIEVNPGQDALLSCKVMEKRGSCHWQKDNKPVGIYKNKYEFDNVQDPGDCSIWIRSAQLEFDDGLWECQVTASDFTTQDALSSRPARFVIRVAPQRPRIEYNSSEILPTHNLTALHGQNISVTCISRFGNPPAFLKWFLDERELELYSEQINKTENDNRRTWMASSTINLAIDRDNYGKFLRCVAIHESYSTRSSSIEVRLDVLYISKAELAGVPNYDIEENQDMLSVRCLIDANPKASIVWKRTGQVQAVSVFDTLEFSPVMRSNAGIYTCHARNVAGESTPVSFHVDVKYSPKILDVGPDRLKTVLLYSTVKFECKAEGNPAPKYQWLQKLSTSFSSNTIMIERGTQSIFVIKNVTYEHQGEYICKVTNSISGKVKHDQSDAITLQVYGAPQILKPINNKNMHELRFEKGDDVTLSHIVCSDPRPRLVSWEWGSFRLDSGTTMGRFKAEDVMQDAREDCYLTTFHISSITVTDSRTYYLTVENDKGYDKHAIQLTVNEAVEAGAFATLLIGSILFLIPLCVCLIIVKRYKLLCCYSKKENHFRASEKNKENVGPTGVRIESIYNTSPLGIPPPSLSSLSCDNELLRGTYYDDDRQQRQSTPDAMKKKIVPSATKVPSLLLTTTGNIGMVTLPHTNFLQILNRKQLYNSSIKFRTNNRCGMPRKITLPRPKPLVFNNELK